MAITPFPPSPVPLPAELAKAAFYMLPTRSKGQGYHQHPAA